MEVKTPRAESLHRPRGDPQESAHPGAAIVVDRLAGDAAGVRREQPGHRARESSGWPIRPWAPPAWPRGRPPRGCPGVGREPVDPQPGHVGVDPARADRVDLQLVGTELGSHERMSPSSPAFDAL